MGKTQISSDKIFCSGNNNVASENDKLSSISSTKDSYRRKPNQNKHSKEIDFLLPQFSKSFITSSKIEQM